ncbi:MAG: HAD family hydrolase [Oscillospiraceae bacterium]|jgi:Cof subfamily protein (haloacid dehalogenase superfamily)|nr:HAD family hydrolase [Oscillospiraceae bacterium]
MNSFSEIRMIVTDLDRTLLRSDKSLSDFTAEILLRCRAHGIKVVFATARSEASAQRFTDAIQPDAVISNGGALARSDGKTIYDCPLPAATANRLLRRCAADSGVGWITIETVTEYLVNHPIDPADSGWLDYRHARPVDFTRETIGPAYKIVIACADERRVRTIADAFPDVDLLRFAGEDWFRLAHRKATKWAAVQAVSAHFGVPISAVAAFGDDYNDVEMLRGCGFGVAVANAIPEAKAAAKFACGSNDADGVAQWLTEQGIAFSI